MESEVDTMNFSVNIVAYPQLKYYRFMTGSSGGAFHRVVSFAFSLLLHNISLFDKLNCGIVLKNMVQCTGRGRAGGDQSYSCYEVFI